MIRKIIFGTFFFLWIIILVLLSIWPSASITIRQEISEFRWDYLEHFLLYLILGFLYIFWRIDKDYRILPVELIIFLLAGFIFSWFTEYIQYFTPGRSFNIYDMSSNMIGVFFGTAISYFIIARILFKNWRKKKAKVI